MSVPSLKYDVNNYDLYAEYVKWADGSFGLCYVSNYKELMKGINYTKNSTYSKTVAIFYIKLKK